MNCGKHCTLKDYYLLMDTTENYLRCLDSGDSNALTSKLNIYLEFIQDFDYIVAEKMRIKVKKANGDLSLVKKAIKDECDELIQNVLVDIQEHN